MCGKRSSTWANSLRAFRVPPINFNFTSAPFSYSSRYQRRCIGLVVVESVAKWRVERKGKKEKISQEYGIHIKMGNVYRNSFRKPRRKRAISGYIFGKVVLTNLVLKKWVSRMWIGFIWFMVRTTLKNTEISTRISQKVGIWPASDHQFPRNQLHGMN